MCFGNDEAEKSRQQASLQQAELQRRERERQADVRKGARTIDDAFLQFNDRYFNNYVDSYKSSLLPGLDRDYQRSNAKLVANLAGRGTLESTEGARAVSDLKRINDDTRVDIGNRALDAANALRGNVEAAKGDLYSLNSQAADPKLVNARAFGTAGALAQAPSTNPLGNVFASALQPVQSYVSALNNRAGPAYKSPYSSKVKSGKVVS